MPVELFSLTEVSRRLNIDYRTLRKYAAGILPVAVSSRGDLYQLNQFDVLLPRLVTRQQRASKMVAL